MNDELFRVEAAVTATACGDLTWERWPLDCAIALGIAGQRNPLGFAVVRYLSGDPSSATALAVILNLSTALIGRGHDAKLTNDAAWSAVEYWNNAKCPRCFGRGVLNIEQAICPVCSGTGKRDIEAFSEVVRDGISALMEAERWMEGQLAARLRGQQYETPRDGHRLNLPAGVGIFSGSVGNQRTARDSGHE
jgi:hypothetical protein